MASAVVMYGLAMGGCRGAGATPPMTPHATTPIEPQAAAATAPSTSQTAPPPAPSSRVPPEMAAVVALHRQTIVLVEDDTTLSPDDRAAASLVGRLLFQQTHQRLTTLTERLVAEVAATPSPASTTAFLDVLERDAGLRDADKLAFLDVVVDLAEAVKASGPPTSALASRLDEDVRALREIEGLYNQELERIFGRFDARGLPVRREAWDSYLAFLRSTYRAADIVSEHRAEVDVVRRPADAAKSPSLEVSGVRLPPKTLVLTFDDGPHGKHTDRIREILARYRVPAVFFHVGQNLGTVDAAGRVQPTRAAAASRRLVADGHAIANHTFAHELLPALSDRGVASQLEQADQLLRSIVSPPSPLFRPPYGARDAGVLAAVQARRLTSVMWNIDSRDWADPVPKSIAHRVVQTAEAERRGIVLFHDIHSRTVEALPMAIEALQQRGYAFAGWNGTGFSVPVSSEARSTAVAPPPSAPLYRESWAVVVGVDQYAHWPKLSYAANDARGVRDLLVAKFGFKADHITVLLNEQATRDRILSAIGDHLADPTRVSRDDRVFVFFAGHGATRTLPNGRSLGYLIPVDADRANYQSQAISMTNFQDVSDAIPAKHVLFVMDACYSGLAATRGASQGFLQEMGRRMARQVLTAGGADEEVADGGPNGHSVFTWTLLQGLEGRADLNGDTFITASELAAYVGPSVSSVARQTPAFASLPGGGGGEFIFELPHETEFLSEESRQLDAEGIRLNRDLDRVRADLAAKHERNERLRQELAAAKAELAGAAVPPVQAAVQLNDAGTALFREKRYAEALDAFLASARLDPSSALVANNVGFAYHRLARHGLAVDWFQKAIALDAKRAIAYANLGDAYLGLGRATEAQRAYESYLDLQPTARHATTVREKLSRLRR